MADQPTDEQTWLTQKIIWLAMQASVIIYAGVGYMRMSQASETSEFNVIFVSALAVISLMLAGTTFALKKKMYKAAGIEPGHGKLNPQKSIIPNIIAWGLSESIAVFGLVLTFTEKNFQIGVPFSCASIFLIFLHKPVREM